jgi:pimeloyl-ACP methyl ester carboxylesterase
MTTKVRSKGGPEVTLHTVARGNPDGYPILVLPWRQWEPDYFRPWFHGIEDEHRVYYVMMPKVGDFKGLERDAGTNLVNYPTKVLAEALVAVMKEAGLERFSVIGHGPSSCTQALILAAEHPKSVSHLMLINPRSKGAMAGEAIANVINMGEKAQNHEIWRGGESILIDRNTNRPTYTADDAAEAGGLGRAMENLRFADACDPFVGQFNFLFESGDSAQTLADSEWTMQKIFDGDRPRVASLVILGSKDPWTPANDVGKVAGFLGTKLVTMRNSSEFPFMFETYAFTQHINGFLKPADKAYRKKNAKKGK